MDDKDRQYQEYLAMREGRKSQSEDADYGERYYEEARDHAAQADMQRHRERQEAEAYRAMRQEGKAQAGKVKKKKKKKYRVRKLRIAVLVLLILVIGVGGVIATGITVAKKALDNVTKIELDPELIGINPQVDSDLRGYRNIALLGIDSRNMHDDSNSRSDAMIIASINEETNEVKLFSVYRDTYLRINDDRYDKVTHAYYYGGPTGSLYALNKNLDLNIKEVMVVNWKAVADTVDALGGIEIDIQDSEINEMNKFIPKTAKRTGGSDELITKSGKQTVNGVQAVTYARIRKDAATGDYRRNERMKIVVKATFDKAKEMDVKALRKIAKDIMPEITTNMTSSDMLALLLKVNAFEMNDSTTGFPYEVGSCTIGGAWMGPPRDLAANVSKLHEQFFGQEGYIPTQDVQEISDTIKVKSGVY